MNNVSPINVLRIVPSLRVGGIGKMAVYLFPKLNKEKYNVKVCCLYKRGVFVEDMEKAGITVFCLNMKEKLRFDLKYLAGIIRLVRLIKKEKIKIVHTHVHKASTPGRIAAFLAGVPVVIAHEDDIRIKNKEIRMEKILAKFTDRIIAVSGAVKDFYVNTIGVPEEKVSVVYNGIDIKDFDKKVDVDKKKKELGIPLSCKVVGTISRLARAKGHIYFLQAAKIIKKQMPNTKFLVVGGGNILQELRDYSSELGLADDVIFTGERKDIPELLSIMDIFVLPSILEPFGIVILEAMVKIKPVVASSVSGIPEIIQDGMNGFLVPSRSPEALAEKTLFLLRNEDIARKMASEGRKTVESKFALKKIINDTETLYDSLIKEKLKQ